MTIERITLVVVGVLIMATVAGFLATENVYFLYGTLFVGFMLFQAPVTKFCPLPMVLKRMGVKSGGVFG